MELKDIQFNELQQAAFDAMTDPTLNFRQRYSNLAKVGSDMVDIIKYPDEALKLMEQDIFFTMFEGNSPFRPRYCVADFPKFMREGSAFLGLEPPTDIWEAVGNLMCLYHNLTGADGTPNYGGCLDELLDPFVKDEKEARKAIRMLLQHVDVTNGDSFFHINLSGYDNKAARIILDLSAEMNSPCPNMSVLYREDTPDDFALACIKAGLVCSKPSFANDKLYREDIGDYAVVSCYNTLPIGGSGMTLTRLNMHKLPLLASTPDELIEVLPFVVRNACEVIDCRVQFTVEVGKYYETNFLCKEGLVRNDKNLMVGMLGYVGLAECVNTIMGKPHGYGNDPECDALGEKIMDVINAEVDRYEPKYGVIKLHAQVGIMSDTESSPGGRIPIGDEPSMPQHLYHFSRMHKHCVAGCGEIFPFDETVNNNPQAILDIIKGAFRIGVRYISFYSSDADVVRITGYLVKRSDMEKLSQGKQTTHSATVLGKGINEGIGILDRKVRSAEDEFSNC